jgi:hypothetical protein
MSTTFARIYTENINKDLILKTASNLFMGYTVLEGVGYWNGKEEKSIVIEVAEVNFRVKQLGTRYFKKYVKIFAESIKEINKQQEVIILFQDVNLVSI